MKTSKQRRIAIIGGGASGIFASIRCAEIAAEQKLDVDIRVFETSARLLKKVRISGGGRCNVTHHIFEVKDFCLNYPRGNKELLSPFHNFQAADTVKWFEERGVNLKYEIDGRIFPVTDSSETIIDCFMQEANKYEIKLLKKMNVKSLKKLDDGKISSHLREYSF